MPKKILMPALSPTMTEGTIAKWVKKEGDQCSPGEVIAEIETDKATMEVEAVDEGILAKILIPEGTKEVKVNSLIAVLIEEDEIDVNIENFITTFNTSHEEVKNDSREIAKEIREELINSKTLSDSIFTNSKNMKINKRIFASPLAKRIASLKGIALSEIIGSGPYGRIVKNDVLSFSAKKTSKEKMVKIVRDKKEYTLIPHNNMRKVIARRLIESKLTIPHFYLSIECVINSLLDFRVHINANFDNDKNKRVSVNDFIILACAKALKAVPAANASWTESGIMLYNNIDISVAVALEGGLITPIIKNADQKDIIEISLEMKALAKRAKENNLALEEFQGGGFSISNLGMYGVKNFTAIINPPQGCIMAIGGASKRPVVSSDNKIEIMTVMDITLSCDHRVIDGAVGAEFLSAFKKYIEAPVLMFFNK